MHLIARTSAAVAAVLLLATPSAALARDPYPAGDYARGSATDCLGPYKAPVGVAMVGFASPAAARTALANETGWDDRAASVPSQRLKMQNGPGAGATIQCRPETSGLLRAPLPGDLQHRNSLRLWGNDSSGILAGTPIREKTTPDGNCSSHWVANSTGYNEGRDSLETAFQGATPLEGPYPLSEVYWGNTASITQCDLSSVAGDGNVTIIHPKDDFGLNENLRGNDSLSASQFRNPPPPGSTLRTIGNCTQTRRTAYGDIKDTVMARWQALGVTTVRFGLNWDSVAPCSAAGAQTQWAWELWDVVIPQLAAAGIHPIIVVKSPPPQQSPGDPQWTDPICSDPSKGSALVNTSGGLSAWRAFVAEVASRYGADAKAIEIWNEPNTPDYWGGCDPSVDGYLQILNAAGRGVVQDSTHPNVPLVLAAPAPATPPRTGQVRWDDYLRDVLNINNWNQLDLATQAAVKSVGLHPYRTRTDRDANKGPDQSALSQLNLAEQIVANNGLDKPVWVTEVGTTNAKSCDPNSCTEQSPTYVGDDPTVQGFYDYLIYDTLRNGGAPLTTIHRFADKPVVSGTPYSSDYGYGVVDDSLAAKYGYCLLAQERTQVYPQLPQC